MVELVHPWPEWMELMEVLVKQNYFDHRRQRDGDDDGEDEVMMVQSLGIDVPSSSNVGAALFQDFRAVQNACVNFGKDRFDILRFLHLTKLMLLSRKQFSFEMCLYELLVLSFFILEVIVEERNSNTCRPWVSSD